MALRKNRKTKRKPTKKKRGFSVNIGRLCTMMFVFFILVISVFAVGYVIFFRTVLAQELVEVVNNEIIFEEPDPPEHDEGLDQKEVLLKVDLPKVAIIFDDLGYHDKLGEKLLAMPIELTYSFLPFAPFTKKLERLAHRRGKTVFLHLPLEAKSKDWDPGPGALFLEDTPEVQMAKFDICLDEVPHAVGINNHMGSLFTENEPAMIQLMRQIEDRSLLFVDSYTTSNSVGLRTAQDFEIRSARRHVFLDNVLTEAKICEQLEKLVGLAEKRGWGIGIAHPHQVTLDAIRTCAEKLRTRVEYVSVKEVLH